jgi:hypothetical protein
MVTLVSRPNQAVRRLVPSAYKLSLTTHVILSVGWLGVVVAKLVLGLAALASRSPGVADALYVAMNVLNVAFPPLAIGTIVTGVVLSLGTKWGLLQHYWVATKLVLTVGVVVTAVQLTDRIIRQASVAPAGPLADAAATLGTASALPLLTGLAVTHLLMLATATVLSVYKPWGKTWLARDKPAQELRAIGVSKA